MANRKITMNVKFQNIRLVETWWRV